jgi:hypothetical protein
LSVAVYFSDWTDVESTGEEYRRGSFALLEVNYSAGSPTFQKRIIQRTNLPARRKWSYTSIFLDLHRFFD